MTEYLYSMRILTPLSLLDYPDIHKIFHSLVSILDYTNFGQTISILFFFSFYFLSERQLSLITKAIWLKINIFITDGCFVCKLSKTNFSSDPTVHCSPPTHPHCPPHPAHCLLQSWAMQHHGRGISACRTALLLALSFLVLRTLSLCLPSVPTASEQLLCLQVQHKCPKGEFTQHLAGLLRTWPEGCQSCWGQEVFLPLSTVPSIEKVR